MRTRTSILVYGLLLCFFCAQAQNKLIDSLKLEWSKTSENELKTVILEELCFQFFNSTRQDSLKRYASLLHREAANLQNSQLEALATFYESQSWFRTDSAKLFELSDKSIEQSTVNKCQECLALNHLGRAVKYRNLVLYDEALNSLQSGLELSTNPKSKRMKEIRASIHIIFSVVLHYKGKYFPGLEHGLDALKWSENLSDPYLKQKAYNSLAAIYGELYSPDNNFGTEADRLHFKSLAKYYMLKTYEGSLLVSSKRVSSVAAYNLGMFFSESKQYDSSKIFLNSAIRLGLETNYFELLSNAYNVKGGDMANVNPDSALWYLDKAIFYAHEADFASNEATAMISKASVLSELKRVDEALTLAQKALVISLQADVPVTQLNAYKLLAELQEKRGNKDLAFDYFQKHIAIKDSLVSAENFARIEDLKARYDSEIKDNEIQNLSQKAAIQGLEIRQRNVLVFSLLAFILLASVVIFLWVRQRSITQQQRQLSLENRFLRFQLNPHFLSNALVSIQRFLFDSNVQQAGDYLSRFARLMRQFLEYSRKDVIPLEDEIEVLRNYVDIQKLGFANGFTYSITVDDALDTSSDKIPPMFTQPFVENALEHGIKGMTDGKIEISFIKSGQFVEVIVQDNGRGLEDHTKSNHNSLATTIIRERIALLNKTGREKISMEIGKPLHGGGTRVRILLPIYD